MLRKIHRKKPVPKSFSNNVSDLRPALYQIKLQCRCFPVDFATFFTAALLQNISGNTSGRLVLGISRKKQKKSENLGQIYFQSYLRCLQNFSKNFLEIFYNFFKTLENEPRGSKNCVFLLLNLQTNLLKSKSQVCKINCHNKIIFRSVFSVFCVNMDN